MDIFTLGEIRFYADFYPCYCYLHLLDKRHILEHHRAQPNQNDNRDFLV